jgi:hypothetical protein
LVEEVVSFINDRAEEVKEEVGTQQVAALAPESTNPAAVTVLERDSAKAKM